MDQRIRKLLVEAGVINNNFNPLAYEQWYLDSLEKFAQLIVRECMGIAQEYDGAKLGGPGLIIAMRIEQHFGVEE